MSTTSVDSPGREDRKEAQLRAFLARRRGLAERGGIERADRTAPIPTSFGQRRLWFQRELDPVAGSRNLVFAWALDGQLDPAALFRAVGLVVGRHEVLRLRIEARDGEPYQTVADPVDLPVDVVEVAGDTVQEREGEARRLIAEAMRPPLPLDSGLLLRMGLWRVAPERHLLALAVPHIAFDDWSVGLLFTEMAAGYEALVKGEEAVLPALPVQYPDYAAWQRGLYEQEGPRAWVEEWAESMTDAPPVLELPAARPRQQSGTVHTETVDIAVAPRLAGAVERLAEGEAATPFMVYLAVYCLLLAELSGSEDIVVGTPVTTRTVPALEPLLGFFVNTLILRADVDRAGSFEQLLHRVKSRVLELMEHSHTPYELLVERLNPARIPGANPVVQSMLTLQSGSASTLRLAGLRAEPIGAGDGASEYDLVVALAPGGEGPSGGEGMRARLFYSADLFDRETVEGFGRRYLSLIEACTSEPKAPLCALEATGDSAGTWGLTGPVAPAAVVESHDVGLRVRAGAAAHPGRRAVLADDGELTFAELDRRADALAGVLLRSGAGPERTVGVHLPRSCALAVAVLATWRAGAVFVPLDPNHPDERLSGIAADADLKVVVNADGAAPSWWHGETVAVGAGEGTERPALPVPHPASLAYLIYTSGTTGKPKGVGVSYANLTNLAWAVGSLADFRAETAANVLAPSFDGWIWSMVLPLAHGKGVVMADPVGEESLDELLTRTGAGAVTVTPSLLGVSERLPDTLDTLVVAGEPCPPALIRRWAPGRRFVNAYGPSEITICATWADSLAGDDVSTIGRPIGNYRVHVVDRYLRAVPPGVTGELLVGGAGVTRGYRNSPGLTARRFVADPFAKDGGRLYRTGDLVSQRPDGTMQFVGRLDQQVKIRGFRVEPGEIERRAVEVPGVADCAAVVLEGGHVGTLGLALVAAEAGTETASALVRGVQDVLERELPSFMVPTRIVVVEALPLTRVGKLDQERLAQDFASAEAPRQPTSMTPLEAVIAGLWAEALDCPVPDASGNFFDLGGHSLVAAKLMPRLSEALGTKLSVRHLMTRPTVRALAGEAERLGAQVPRP
ncbi:amino acid adenylation domain-containing protein [Kitasatospora sp. NPDC004669]|uniref:non-ribosomal peptide synthetase n=1 Tax=Kitasatospora sp. NPDC004669 TaxID=3154555 RepID=UPI0033AB521F